MRPIWGKLGIIGGGAVLGLLLSVSPVFALVGIDEPIIPCGFFGQPSCQFCHFFALIQNIYNFLVLVIVPPLAILMIAIAGFLLLTAGGRPGQIQRGWGVVQVVIAGLIMVYVSWLVISFGISLVARQVGAYDPAVWNEPGSWFNLNCPIGI